MKWLKFVLSHYINPPAPEPNLPEPSHGGPAQLHVLLPSVLTKACVPHGTFVLSSQKNSAISFSRRRFYRMAKTCVCPIFSIFFGIYEKTGVEPNFKYPTFVHEKKLETRAQH